MGWETKLCTKINKNNKKKKEFKRKTSVRDVCWPKQSTIN